MGICPIFRHPRERGDLLRRRYSHEIPACAGKTARLDSHQMLERREGAVIPAQAGMTKECPQFTRNSDYLNKGENFLSARK